MIAREAWPLLLLALLAAWLAHAVCGYACAVPLIALALIIPYLYREPVCRVPPSPLAVVSPVHGRVAAKETARDPYLRRMAVRIVIRKPVFGPFALRSPIEGRVVQQWYLPEGLEPVAADGEAAVPVPADHQERYAVWIQTDERDDVVMVIRGAFINRRLRGRLRVGERLGQGQRCGLLQFAATTEVYVPANSRVTAASGDAVKAGSAIIATLVHKGPPAAAG